MSFLGNKTQRMHPLYVPVANKADYFFYTAFRRINPFSVIALALLIYSLVGFVGDIRSLFSDSVWDRVLYIAAFILSGVVKVLNLAAHYEDRFTTDEIDKDFFKDVDVPNGDWQRLELRMGDKETEPVFFSEKIDKLLRSDTPIDIRRDKEYEKRLGAHIRKKENWEATYSKFLRHNHRKAMYSGKQFYNEAKYGLSSDPTPSADPTKPVEAVKIHKTCYFDSYLTNIIPGQVLTRNRDKEVMASALEAGWLPFTAEGEERRLRATGECAMANEPGVTTLCIKENDTIILWRQNHLAQCSTGQLVASGSGSANWGDCRKYLHDPDKNGLRKAVRRGMERQRPEILQESGHPHHRLFPMAQKGRQGGIRGREPAAQFQFHDGKPAAGGVGGAGRRGDPRRKHCKAEGRDREAAEKADAERGKIREKGQGILRVLRHGLASLAGDLPGILR